MSKKLISNPDCSGCHACYSVCPKNCISMSENREGFLYPCIDEKICIDCGLCEKICPVLNEYKGNNIGKAYACVNKNNEIRAESSSGGIFTLIAECVLDKNGVVFGAAYDEDLSVHHIEITDKTQLKKFRGSKYLQSRIEDTYKKAKEYLEDGREVLFSGTPCQISGIKAYLGKNYENLILQDIICHGVPSPKVWLKYLDYMQKYKKEKILKEPSPNFRYKENGWKRYSIALYFTNSTEYFEVLTTNMYMKAFVGDLSLRPSCYNCHSKSLERESDLTLADFWGIEKVLPELDDNKGTSLVFVNSEKGNMIFNEISEKMRFKEVDINEATKHNPSSFQSVKIPKNRKKFMELVFEKPFDVAVKKCIPKSGLLRRVASKTKKLIKKATR